MSSHIATDDCLIRDLWPKGLPKLGASHGCFEEIPKRYILPSTLNEILFWVDLDTNLAENDKARMSYVLYHALPGPNSDGGDAEIQFHLQGFVLACNVHPLGTWRANILALMRLRATDERSHHHRQVPDWETVVEPPAIKYLRSTSAT
ncbi:hypothetical protein NLI96_g12985 [Meripilus lineatus]|uniref:Uncharacterized protein n=1 Tax=Meripilus lineatus TaxID=2056292 RepID=A0AAD5Y743_9APHY|nr:hypothetical protein NLI96_g12985 [Physisporinus lineatus]